MTIVRNLHREAMDIADLGDVAKREGHSEKATGYYRQALALESQAAREMTDRLDVEPTRSVLFRSAASLALLCGEWREAERLIASGLAGTPPAEITQELRDLLKQVYAHTEGDLPEPEKGSGEVTITGQLRFADWTTNEAQIKVVGEGDIRYTILVPDNMIDSIVHPLWNTHVVVKGMRLNDGKIMLAAIDKAG
ncbi:MAG: hypothetical protein KF716_09470 [Anaerolineae bacterium]|nr:hypothetical protein [Anaerolineae bacterium]